MSNLLDTNVCVAIMNRSSVRVRYHLSSSIAKRAELYISTVVIHELEYGVANGHPDRYQENTARLQIFLSKLPFLTLPFGPADARAAANVRAQLRRAGRPIGAYDLFLAGQALANDLTLITANESEFSRVKGLKWANWLK